MKKTIKNKKNILKIILICTTLLSLIIVYKEIYSNLLEENLNNATWVRKKVRIKENKKLGSNIYYVKKNKNISIFNLNYQSAIDKEIERLLKVYYSFEAPLIIYNPYGTNNLSLNIYFDSDEEMEISYTISVQNNEISDFTRTLKNSDKDNYTKIHDYQIIGLIPGEINTVKINGKTKDNNQLQHIFTIDMRNIACQSDTILENLAGESLENLEDGLFVLFGLDKAFNSNNYIYDNEGVLRGDLVLHEYRSDRLIFHNENLYYSYDTNKIAVVNRLGKIEETFVLNGYKMHHDYVLDEENNKLLILANSNKEDERTIEDLIISLDIETGEIEKIIDMKDLMPEIYKTAKMPDSGKNTYGGTGLDWIHLNSLSIVNNKEDIVVSAREISTIIYIENIYKKPKIKYLIADKEVYKDTEYEDLLLKQKGDFINHAGQHTITYIEDDKLEKGKYYLAMYNNNYGVSNTRKKFPWDEYPGVGTFEKGETSKYYKYLIDEKKKTYKLIEEFDVPYSSIVSSVQDLDDSYVTSSGKNHTYAEYDKDGVLIKEFTYPSKKYAYRVFKYNFKNIWFN